MVEDLTERLRAIMQEYGYSPSAFADEIRVQRPAISHILSGRNRPSLDVVLKILKAFPTINPQWLLTGEGKMKQLNLFGEEETPTQQESQTQPAETSKPKPEVIPQKSLSKPTEKLPDAPPAPTSESSSATANPSPITPISSKSSTEDSNDAIKSIIPAFQDSSKKIERIIIFYSDKTFSAYSPE